MKNYQSLPAEAKKKNLSGQQNFTLGGCKRLFRDGAVFEIINHGGHERSRRKYVSQNLRDTYVGSGNSEPLIPEILSRSALEGEASSKFR